MRTSKSIYGTGTGLIAAGLIAVGLLAVPGFGETTPAMAEDGLQRSVTVEEAREWARGYLHGGNRAVVRYLPEGPP